MKNCSKKIWLAFAATTVAGACLHFLYDLHPALLTALLSPVNESLWEHLKILYWPCLAAGALLARGRREELAPRMAALLLSCAAMLAVGWAYHVLLRGESLFFDIALYVVLAAVCFFLPCFGNTPLGSGRFFPLALLTALLGAALIVFTFFPPDNILFFDLSGVWSWVTLPC